MRGSEFQCCTEYNTLEFLLHSGIFVTLWNFCYTLEFVLHSGIFVTLYTLELFWRIMKSFKRIWKSPSPAKGRFNLLVCNQHPEVWLTAAQFNPVNLWNQYNVYPYMSNGSHLLITNEDSYRIVKLPSPGECISVTVRLRNGYTRKVCVSWQWILFQGISTIWGNGFGQVGFGSLWESLEESRTPLDIKSALGSAGHTHHVRSRVGRVMHSNWRKKLWRESRSSAHAIHKHCNSLNIPCKRREQRLEGTCYSCY